MNMRHYSIISSLAVISSILLFAIMNGWIIIRIPGIHGCTTSSIHAPLSHKKQVTLHYYHQEKWHKELQTMVIAEQKDIALQQLINAWLFLLEEEKIITKKVTLEDAILDAKQTTIYFSFDGSPFAKNTIIFQKWMIIEGILKTIRENNISITHVVFLIHHQPITLPDLDCSRPWPIQGFMK